ncbi:MAG: energy transducer TonB [Chitinophagales bacterium]
MNSFLASGQSLLSKDTKDVFTVVEDMPIPWFYKTECIDVDIEEKQNCYTLKLKEYLSKNLNYPYKAVSSKTEGTVVIQFVISKDGSIQDAEIVKDIGDGCGAEALKLVNEMPDWVPGRQRGVPVNVRYTLPVKFQLAK